MLELSRRAVLTASSAVLTVGLPEPPLHHARLTWLCRRWSLACEAFDAACLDEHTSEQQVDALFDLEKRAADDILTVPPTDQRALAAKAQVAARALGCDRTTKGAISAAIDRTHGDDGTRAALILALAVMSAADGSGLTKL